MARNRYQRRTTRTKGNGIVPVAVISVLLAIVVLALLDPGIVGRLSGEEQRNQASAERLVQEVKPKVWTPDSSTLKKEPVQTNSVPKVTEKQTSSAKNEVLQSDTKKMIPEPKTKAQPEKEAFDPSLILRKSFPKGKDCGKGMEFKESLFATSGPYALTMRFSVDMTKKTPKWPGHNVVSLGSAGQVFLTPEGKLMLYRQEERRIGIRWHPRAISSDSMLSFMPDDQLELKLVWTGSLCYMTLNGNKWMELPARGTKVLGGIHVGAFPGKLYHIELKAR